ncbi:DUF4360 domain-containing protein [Streptomyces radiopugnans]|uniref:DUF4360 domain-containing protein n=1 Tax=Streptomyces radiopugnans TaxID=403935 RepID=UPI003F534FAF
MSASLLSAQGAPAAEAPPAAVGIDVLTVNGSGCPAGTAQVTVSEGGTAFTVTYDGYLAQVGLAADPTDLRKNCRLVLRVDAPAGHTYAVSGLEHRGYALLQRGASAVQQTSYHFQGSAGTATVSRSFTGPYRGAWRTSDDGGDERVWAPCGEQRDLNVNTSLRVSAGTSPADSVSFTAARSTSSTGTSFELAWKKC